jgi:hypothetical protein
MRTNIHQIEKKGEETKIYMKTSKTLVLIFF